MSRKSRCSLSPASRGTLIATGILLSVTALLLAAGYEAPETTPATGPSWLARLGWSLDDTSLGRVGQIGTTPTEVRQSLEEPEEWIREGFVVDGEDLYRLNCRACHGPGGAGLPPEIRPVLGAIRATSVEIQERVAAAEESGASVAPERMAELARASIRHRLAEGGALMPPFDHVTDPEVEVLLSYLERLAEVPDRPDRPEEVRVPPDRVGEHLVKGTCQTCHDATARVLRSADREIPTLADFPEEYSVRKFIRKARHGSPSGGRRGRMPELSFVSDAELQAAYLYLGAFPPESGD